MKEKDGCAKYHPEDDQEAESGKERLKHFYTRNCIPVYLLCAALTVFGMVSLFSLDVHLVPDIEYPELVVVTNFPDATPEEVKNLITKPVEESAVSMKGVKSVNTISKKGLSVVRIQYRWGVDLSTSLIELRERLDVLKSFFPDEVQRPVIINYQISRDAVAGIVVTSNSLDESSLYMFCKKELVPAIEKTEGISRVEVRGASRPEVKIVADPKALVKYDVSVSEIKSVLGSTNRNFGVGFFEEGNYEYLLRVDGEIKDYRDLEEIVVKEDDKKLVFLRDVARVQYTIEEKQSDVLIDGKGALMLSIYRLPSYSIMGVSRNIDERLNQLQKRYWKSISLQKAFDESIYVRDSLRELIAAMAFGVLFTIFSVYLFLRNLKLSITIIATIPLSIVATFFVMKMAGVSVNLLTLGGFGLAIGMMVDNAVIVVSGVFETLFVDEKGEDFYVRLRLMIPAVVSATLTTIVVFFPIFFLAGVLRVIFLQLSLVIISALLFSLLFSIFLVPLVLIKIRIKTSARDSFAHIDTFFETIYRFLLGAVIKHRVIFLLVLGAVICTGVFLFSALDKRFVESVPKNYFYLKIFIKRQVPFTYTKRFCGYICDILKKDGSVESVVAEIGSDPADLTHNLDGMYGSNTAVLRIYTSLNGEDIYPFIRSLRERLGIFSGVDFIFAIPDNPVERLLLRSEFDACIKLYNPSTAVLMEEAEEVQNFVRDCDFSEDVLSSYPSTHKEQVVELKREELAVYRVETPSLAEIIASALGGIRVGTWKQGEYEIPIRIHLGEHPATDIDDIMELSVKNSEGKEIRLGEVLSTREENAPHLILREDQKTYAKVEFNIKSSGQQSRIFSRNKPRKTVENFLFSKDMDFNFNDQSSLLKENYLELFIALFISIFLEYIILASVFNSFTKPLLVVLMIPLSIPGMILIFYLIGSSLSITTFMSIIVLIGLLVNNAIMLFLEYQVLGKANEKSLVEASIRRLKPILITTLSTILALLPVLFTENKIQVTLASTLILGLCYSTVVTLLYLPVLYLLFYGKRTRVEAGVFK
ncbi:MAG: efflux RND transporter permease subunit [Spirochaetota bacterium]